MFADTGYWAALQDSRDRLHGTALALTNEIESLRIVTTQMVLVEVLNMFGSRGEQQRRLAREVVERAERSVDVEIVPQTAAQFRAALERYTQRSDQTWSLTDCASFIVMEERGITEALAHDRDFEQAGFTALLRRRQ
ncbi:MAG: PIN domain-containing protein [Chloroflexi bacterium]|nr:PIN domain-containing protein [Chloroflexota bacterium]